MTNDTLPTWSLKLWRSTLFWMKTFFLQHLLLFNFLFCIHSVNSAFVSAYGEKAANATEEEKRNLFDYNNAYSYVSSQFYLPKYFFPVSPFFTLCSLCSILYLVGWCEVNRLRMPCGTPLWSSHGNFHSIPLLFQTRQAWWIDSRVGQKGIRSF